MSEVAWRTLPSDISRETLAQLVDDIHNREAILQAMLQRFEHRYGGSLEAVEARLARGEGSEHPTIPTFPTSPTICTGWITRLHLQR